MRPLWRMGISRKKTPDNTPQKIESPENNSKPRPLESLREMIGLVSAGAGIFSALPYLAGRSFASGYFSAMNIPNYQVSFSLWEYGEVAWIPLLLYTIGMMTLSGFLGGVLNIILDWLSPSIVRFLSWLKNKITIRSPRFRFPESSRETKLWFAVSKNSFSLLVLMGLVILTLQFVSDFGKLNGQLHILEGSAQLEIISSIPIVLDDSNPVSVQLSGQDYYVFKSFHLLTFNDGKYYLFKEIDPVTCKPSKVYVINAEQNLQVNLLPVESLAGQCQKGASPQVIATPTSTQSIP